ncbi:unnamed protein product [Linum tenue]|uniref:Protein kinase domain-containing protein n=1 Tax=Linum tenue TaxID=586396 RepID=A0AAV0HL55_9ROSI|nr:unnamed protein product [Linum tenue]
MKLRHRRSFFASTVLLAIVFLHISDNPDSVSAQESDGSSCILDIQPPADDTSCDGDRRRQAGNWGGFIDGGDDCCTPAFDDYLFGLARWASQSGQVFLNSADQSRCLTGTSCGFDKLTRGASGCSSFTVADVAYKLKPQLESLDQGCNFTEDASSQHCSRCSAKWEEIRASLDHGSSSETELCRFAVLVTLTSNWAGSRDQVQPLYGCLSQEILIVSLSVGGVAAILVLLLWIMSRRKSQQTRSPAESGSLRTAQKNLNFKQPNNLKISIKEIYSATNHLTESNFIGQGIAGKVYKGKLSDGQAVAVKHIVSDGHVETFVREVTSLSHVKHPNLVALTGCCKHEDEYFLVYELCENGNLSEWLYIIGQPTNILLDSNFQAKLSDFGLSKVMNLGQSFVSSEVRGTFGYVDPEYQRNHHVNAKGDVYSFGIVLMQILSGQKVINMNHNTHMQLNKKASYIATSGNIAEFADPKLNGEYSTEAFEILFKLALSCSGGKKDRPTMEMVVTRLEKALDISMRSSS